MNNYTKLLIDLVNVDVKIEEEDKALILLNSLPDEEYETFTLTLINCKQILHYSDMLVALVNYEVRRHDKLSSSEGTLGEALAISDRSYNWKGKGDRGGSKSTKVMRSEKEPVCLLQRVRALED